MALKTWFVASCSECGRSLGGFDSPELAESEILGLVKVCPDPACGVSFSVLNDGRRWNFRIREMPRPPSLTAKIPKAPAAVSPSRQKAHCLRCDKQWEPGPDRARDPCPQCGEPNWDKEVDLGPYLMPLQAYRITNERMDQAMVLTLELQAVDVRHSTHAVLSHRLKTTYRHQKGDLSVKDGKELIITLENPNAGPNKGLWVITDLHRAPPPALFA